MPSPKRLPLILLACLLLSVVYQSQAQKIDEKTYQHKIRLIDSLSFYRMEHYDTLFKVSFSYNLQENDHLNVRYGWIDKQDKEHILFLNTNGIETDIKKSEITGINWLPISDTTVDILAKRKKEPFRIFSFGDDYLLCLWLYKKGKFNYSKQLLPENDKLFSDEDLRDDFGIIYYDAMLSAFSIKRNYKGAITFGNHLSNKIFKGYGYQKEAIALTSQLKKDTGDFKSFHIPDSLEWAVLKQKLNRKEQVIYLADRLRLLNCIQLSQPGGISYTMLQFSISFAEAQKAGILYWDRSAKYGVINPFIELLHMKLNLLETELLLPYLLSDNYINSYSYFRDFRPERTLHKHSWAVHSLIFEITDKLFFDQRGFDSLSVNRKRTAVDKIKKWCEENALLSKEDLTIKTLKTTNNWTEFKKALTAAKNEKYNSFLPVIVNRYNDFKSFYWPVHKYLIAETVYELGDEKYIQTVRKWSRDTTSQRDTTDLELTLWTSLFLLKYDHDNYEYAMNKLAYVLRKCDGTAYYPKAMELLLSMKNDKRALKLAEGILDKEGFQSSLLGDYYLNFVKKLLLLKSDYTFNFINKKLGSFTPVEAESFKNKGNTNMLMQSDFYVLAVDKLKGSPAAYDTKSSFETRVKYKEALSKWFAIQYNLLKNGQPNGLLLNISPADAPVSFVDTPN